ncbi:MAG: alpha/beta hydrolase [Prevotellaceae bacterium]|jgi:pimeloyl-ACP methyl ester carboxylesterase|nr:alpha/beta hydrolase [Prevotellaceae bacterium]
MKKIISALVLIMLLNSVLFAQDITGVWYGVLKTQGLEFPIGFSIEKEGEQYSAAMSVPKQNMKDAPVKTTTFSNDTLTFEIPRLTIIYKGVVDKNGTIKGKFTQFGQEYILDLGREKTFKDVKRPQEPKPPYPYISEDIKFKNESANINLAGTITIPEGRGKYPAVVLVSGSGSQDRNEEVLDHRPFLVLSDYLTRNGIAVLRYDDRGFAESEGDAYTSTTADFATDALAGVHYLQSRKEVNPKRVGIIGHSEGGIIAFMLAAKEKDVAFVISMAGSAIRGDSIFILQNEIGGRGHGMTEEALLMARSINRSTYDVVLNADSKEEIEEKLTEMFGTSDRAKARIEQMSNNWMRFFLKYDPSVDIQNIHIPVFAMFGSKDYQVPADPNAESFNAYIPASNKNAGVKIYANKNHLFQNAVTGMFNEYQEIEETMSPEVLQDIVDWIKMINRNL